jgi:hypothetical protein
MSNSTAVPPVKSRLPAVPDTEFNVDLPGMIDSVSHLLRGVVLIGIFALLVTAAYYSLEVFQRLGQLVQDPAVARPAVKSIADMIGAEQMVIQQQDKTFHVGDVAAYVLLLATYLLWIYVPATIISVCSRVLLSGYLARRR